MQEVVLWCVPIRKIGGLFDLIEKVLAAVGAEDVSRSVRWNKKRNAVTGYGGS